MQRIALTDLGAPPLADLVRNSPVFSTLPLESGACLKRLQEGALETYSAHEMQSVTDDIDFVCSGAFAADVSTVLSAGDVVENASLAPSLRATCPSSVLRFAP